MKAVFIAFLLVTSIPAYAGDWSRADTQREAAYLTLHLADWAQTRYIARHLDTWHETNPILSERPSVGRVDGYFAATALVHIGIAWALAPVWRERFQWGMIAVEAIVVLHNRRVGVSIAF